MAAIALLSWPVLCLVAFSILGRSRGLIWMGLFGYLFLPEAYHFDIPSLPPYNKYSAITFGLLLGFAISKNETPSDRETVLQLADPVSGMIVRVFLIGLLVSPLGTWYSNQEVLVDGGLVRSNVTLRDALQSSYLMFIHFVPMFLAWRCIKTPNQIRELVLAICIMAGIYSIFVIVEWRLSPQLHIWLYGYFQHDWLQHLRGGGYRPIVFLKHGLEVGVFLIFAIMTATFLFRKEKERQRLYLIMAIWFIIVLFLSRNFGAFFLISVFTPIVLFAQRQVMMNITFYIAVFFILYPVIKQFGLSPENYVIDFFSFLSPDRAASLGIRVANENDLLARAQEKLLFGWGGHGRIYIINEYGRTDTLVDGIWIINLTKHGWVGFICFFGITVMPIFALKFAAKRKEIDLYIICMAIVLSINLIDMIPNSSFGPVLLFFLGAIMSYAQFDAEMISSTNPLVHQATSGKVDYSRFGDDETSGEPIAYYSNRKIRYRSKEKNFGYSRFTK